MATDQLEAATRDNYRWVALTNTTAAVFMSALDGSPHSATVEAISDLIVDAIRAKTIALVVNTTQGSKEVRDSYSLRRHTLLANIPYFTTMSAALGSVQPSAAATFAAAVSSSSAVTTT